jgi:hypothetical protein
MDDMQTGTFIAAAILGPAIAAVVAYNALGTWVTLRRRFLRGRRRSDGVAQDGRSRPPEPMLCAQRPCADGCG